MAVFQLDPLRDPRWRSFIELDPRSSIFHTTEWLEALRRTYHYDPVVFTTCPAGVRLTNGIVFCQINSRLMGSKLVSLPFSDHCEPLVQDSENLREILFTIKKVEAGRTNFAEIRPRAMDPGSECGLTFAGRYCFHALDLKPNLEELHAHFQKDGMQRKIRRADREGVVMDQGNSELFLDQFYRLLLLTRRRHRLPPQPFSWFRNLSACMGDRLVIYVASLDRRPIAAILTLRFRQTLVYKYGCSDKQFHNIGGMPRLFWQAIQDAKSHHLVELDLGRSDEDNEGLLRFKDHLGAARSPITYWQSSDKPFITADRLGGALKSSFVQKLLASLPDSLYRLAGEVFYRHAG
jgi:hypothetical protein